MRGASLILLALGCSDRPSPLAAPASTDAWTGEALPPPSTTLPAQCVGAAVTIGGGATYATLEDALSAAAAGDELFLCEGTYVGPFDIERAVTLTALGAVENTILDGDQQGSTVGVFTPDPVTLRGLTITGGTGEAWPGGTVVVGGCVHQFDNGGDLTIADSVITGCEAEWGGGIYHVGDLTLRATTLVGNTAQHGGGMYSAGELMGGESRFEGNTAQNRGGGLFADRVVALDGLTVFTGNEAKVGGGLYVSDYASLDGGGALVESNRATDGGGVATEAFTLENLNIRGNVADAGGGLALFNGFFVVGVGNVTIEENEARLGGGIAVFGGGAVFDSVVSRNHAVKGGGIYHEGYSLPLSTTLVSENTASVGGGLFARGPFTASEVDVRLNEAVNGAGIAATSSFELIGGTVSENAGSGVGGALYLGADGESSATDVLLEDNSAKLGGGLYLDSSHELTVTGGTLRSNEANYGAAGLVDGGASLSTHTVEIDGNEASRGPIFGVRGSFAFADTDFGLLNSTPTVTTTSDQVFVGPVSGHCDLSKCAEN